MPKKNNCENICFQNEYLYKILNKNSMSKVTQNQEKDYYCPFKLSILIVFVLYLMLKLCICKNYFNFFWFWIKFGIDIFICKLYNIPDKKNKR